MVQQELQYLKEIGRITAESALIIESLNYSIGLEVCQLPFAQIVTEAITQDWTRDPFDRLIIAQSRVRKTPLLTKDRTILEKYTLAFW
jgi:PIN domain nuclease of toxin-antitoxin system